MLKINDSQVDLILQVEEDTNINNILNLLNLDIDYVLIICPVLFLQRFVADHLDKCRLLRGEGITYCYELNDDYEIDHLEKQIESKYVRLLFNFKGKHFNFNFIILTSEQKIIDNPFKGEQVYKVGIKEIKI